MSGLARRALKKHLGLEDGRRFRSQDHETLQSLSAARF
jgi:hypothetical protein